MQKKEIRQLLSLLIRMGEALQNCGAEVYRVEDTLNRIGYAYGAEDVNAFVITSSIVLTIKMPEQEPETQTRRLTRLSGNDLLMLERLNALSRHICAAPPSVEEFGRQLDETLRQPFSPRQRLVGSILAASSFAIFFGGSLWDGLLAGCIAVLIWLMQEYLEAFCLNEIEFQFIASFLSGAAICLLCRALPLLHTDKVIIGDIMLLIPGIMLTNSVRDILLGDLISGLLRLAEALLLAAALALGIMAALWLIGGSV